MHMADGFVSPAVGCTMWAATAAITVLCARRIKQRKRRLGQNFLMLQGGLGGLFVQRGYVQFVHDGCK